MYVASNYRPITWLPFSLGVVDRCESAITRETEVLWETQQSRRGIHDFLFMDKMVLRDCQV